MVFLKQTEGRVPFLLTIRTPHMSEAVTECEGSYRTSVKYICQKHTSVKIYALELVTRIVGLLEIARS